MTQKQAAEVLGISRQAVAKRVQAGTLRALPDGSLDPASVRRAQGSVDPLRVRAARDAAPRRRPEPTFAEEYPALEEARIAYDRHRRRLTRRHRLGLITTRADRLVIEWAMFEVISEGTEIAEHVSGPEFGKVVCDALTLRSLGWLLDETGRAIIKGEEIRERGFRWRHRRSGPNAGPGVGANCPASVPPSRIVPRSPKAKTPRT